MNEYTFAMTSTSNYPEFATILANDITEAKLKLAQTVDYTSIDSVTEEFIDMPEDNKLEQLANALGCKFEYQKAGWKLSKKLSRKRKK